MDPNDILAPLKVIDTKMNKYELVIIQGTKFYTLGGCSFVHGHDLLGVTGKLFLLCLVQHCVQVLKCLGDNFGLSKYLRCVKNY